MATAVEVFVSDAGVFLAAPAACGLWAAKSLVLARSARVLRDATSGEVLTARLPHAAVRSLEGIGHLPVAAFALGGVSRAAVLRLMVED